MSDKRDALVREFAEMFDRAPDVVAEAPGRVNLIGEHTDYNGGFVLPVAIERSVIVAAGKRDDGRLHAYALDYDAVDESGIYGEPLPAGGWKNYVRGVARLLAETYPEVRGADIALSGNVPQGAGLSSSAALEVAVAGGISRAFDVDVEPKEIALLAHTAENEFVGVPCGIMDQFAAALSEAGHALLIDCRLRDATPVPIPDDIAIVVVDSGVARNLADTEYQRRREECMDAADFLDIDSLREVPEQRLPDIESELEPPLFQRVRHVVTEDGRVLAAADALRRSDMTELGRLLYRSHESLREDFEVSTPELDRLVEIARDTEGVIGARLTGAGFGGSVVTLMRPDALPAFEEAMSAGYSTPDGRPATVRVCKASDGLKVTRA